MYTVEMGTNLPISDSVKPIAVHRLLDSPVIVVSYESLSTLPISSCITPRRNLRSALLIASGGITKRLFPRLLRKRPNFNDSCIINELSLHLFLRISMGTAFCLLLLWTKSTAPSRPLHRARFVIE
jgi:hypothetical protein